MARITRSSITFIIPGFGSKGEAGSARLEARATEQLSRMGIRDTDVAVWPWSDRQPILAAGAGGGTGALLGKALKLGPWGLLAVAGIGALVGVAKSYAGARRDTVPRAEDFAQELLRVLSRNQGVNVIALSLGTEVALDALELLAGQGMHLDGAVFLLGGTAERSERWSRAVRVPLRGVFNIHNPADGVLRAERTVRAGEAIGLTPLGLCGVRDLRTAHGHYDQLDHLAEIVLGFEGRTSAPGYEGL